MIAVMIAEVDPISGGAGWVGAGLLGAVLAWLLLVYLPSKDKLTKDMTDGHNNRIDKLFADKLASEERMRCDFKASLDKILEHCSDEIRRVILERKT